MTSSPRTNAIRRRPPPWRRFGLDLGEHVERDVSQPQAPAFARVDDDRFFVGSLR
jgi:hypothetical protein